MALRNVLVNWTDTNTTESGYEVERKLMSEPDSAYVNVGNVPTNTEQFMDSVEENNEYCWRIRAKRFEEFGPYSMPVCMMVSIGIKAPINVTVIPQ